MSVLDDLNLIETALGEVVVPTGYKPIQRIYNLLEASATTTAELPAYLLLWNEPSKLELMTFGTLKESNIILVNFLYKPVGQGVTKNTLSEIFAYRQPTMDALVAHLNLYGQVLGQLPIRCTLPMELKETWSGVRYLGFQMAINIIEQHSETFGS